MAWIADQYKRMNTTDIQRGGLCDWQADQRRAVFPWPDRGTASRVQYALARVLPLIRRNARKSGLGRRAGRLSAFVVQGLAT